MNRMMLLTIFSVALLSGPLSHAEEAKTETSKAVSAARAPAARADFTCASASKHIKDADAFAKDWMNKNCDFKGQFSTSLGASGQDNWFGVLVCCNPK